MNLLRLFRNRQKPRRSPVRGRRHFDVERLENRELLSLSWTGFGERSIVGDTVNLGVAGRPEFGSQLRAIHGGSALVLPAPEYTFTFDHDLRTWDSYTTSTSCLNGYWDSFSVSVTGKPYTQLSISDPVSFPFVYGGNCYGDGTLESSVGTRTITVTGNPNGSNYVNAILDTFSPPNSDTAYPSWGTITVHFADIQIISTKFDGSSSKVSFQYASINTTQFTVGLYRSADMTFGSGDIQVATQTVDSTGMSAQTGSFSFATPLLGDSTRPYLLVVADSSGAINEAAEGNNTASVVLPAITLKTTPNLRRFTLMQDVVFEVTVSPTGTTASSYTIERRKTTVSTWDVLSMNQSATLTQRLAGYFKGRGSATIDGIQFFSREMDFEVQFPSYADIVGNADVQTATNAAWSETKTYADNNKGAQDASGAYPDSLRREQGFFIRLNTETGKYEFTATVNGAAVGPTQGAGISLGATPADVVIATSGVYTVARFHTHTPTTYREVGRPVGPSQADIDAANSTRLVGVVYDYVAADAAGNIPAGHPLHSAAQRYQYGPLRRPTPRP